ncbi:hypothetical protein FPV67DRAFT_1506503 [Lyophyllum atratum]|nr:hypothetical protein FPV67DRAFT_1506503 [Lyophyllum atratum]
MKEDIDVDFAAALTKKAVVFTIQQKKEEESMEVAIAAGRTPTCRISVKDPEPYVVSLEGSAKQRGYEPPYFENAWDRRLRLERGDHVSVSMIFLPTGRATAKRVNGEQLFVWDIVQNKERTTTNPPMIYWSIMMLNTRIDLEIMEDKKKAEGKGGEDEATREK